MARRPLGVRINRVPMYMQPKGAWGIATNTLEFFKYKWEALFKW